MSKEIIIHRVCRYCYKYTQTVKDWNKEIPPDTIECPNCKRFGLELRTISQIEYMEWKGIIGYGKQLRDMIKEANNGKAQTE